MMLRTLDYILPSSDRPLVGINLCSNQLHAPNGDRLPAALRRELRTVVIFTRKPPHMQVVISRL